MPRRPPPQLFDDAGAMQDRAGEETEAIYALVDQLRRRGHTVHRAGARHVVNGKHLSTREFMEHGQALLTLPKTPPP